MSARDRQAASAVYAAYGVLFVLLAVGGLLGIASRSSQPASQGEWPYGELVPTAASRLPAWPSPTPEAEAESEAISPFRRAGFGISTSASPETWSSRLGAGWYLDWRAAAVPSSRSLEYWPMVRLSAQGARPSPEEISQIAQANPGRVWIIGNEPDVIWQDNLPPLEYARVYRQLYTLIKQVDPTAKVAVGGVSQATPLRLQYLDLVLETYRQEFGGALPADWWTVHGFVLREQRDSWGVGIPPGLPDEQGILYEIDDHDRLDYFAAHLRNFRSWLAQNGYRETPLALTEFGILMPPEYGFPSELVSQYLRDTFDLLLTLQDQRTGYPADEYRLVQRWAWFSLSDPLYPTANLGDLGADRLTPVGLAYREFIQSLGSP